MSKLARVLAPLVVALATLPAVAGASPLENAYSGGYRGNAPHSPNFIWQSSLIAPDDWITGTDWFPPSSLQQASDLAFTGNYVLEAEYTHFRFVDVSDPKHPREVPGSNTLCPAAQGDVIVFGNLMIRGQESSHNIPNGDLHRSCETAGAGEAGVAFVGLTILDISDVSHPRQIIGVPTCGGSHTITKYYDDVKNRLIILSTSGSKGTSAPQWGLDCSAGVVTSGRVDAVEVPLDHPERAHLLSRYVPTGGATGGCHDVNTFEELHLIAVACNSGNQASLIDVRDFDNPQILWTFTYPGISTMHTAGFSWSGRYVYVDAEPGGGSNDECNYDDDPVKYTLFIIDRVTGRLVGQWHMSHPQATQPGGEAEYCTLHELNTVPFIDRNVIASSCYNCGNHVVDVTNARAPREVGFWDPPPSPGPVTTSLSDLSKKNGEGCWTGYWYNDDLYCNEELFGLHVWTVNEPWWREAVTMGELNPQTMTRRMRCSVSVTGGPKRARKAGRVIARVSVFGPVTAQPAWGAKVEVSAPGFFRLVKTGESGTVSVSVKASKAGKLRVTVPEHENMLGCAAPAKSIARMAR